MEKMIESEEIVIKDKKKVHKGTIVNLTLFAKMKILQVETVLSEQFYLVFYNNSIIYGDLLPTIEKGSFIDQARNLGISFEKNNPLIPALITSKSIKTPNTSNIFNYLQDHYTLKDVAYIATALDSFFPKEKLTQVIDKIILHFRRNGNFLEAFQVNQLLSTFSSSLATQDRLVSDEYKTYSQFYSSSSLSSIYKKDPLYVEFYCFENRHDPSTHTLLEDHLLSEERYSEVLCLSLERFINNPGAYPIEFYTDIARKFIPFKQWLKILVTFNVNPFHILRESQQTIEKMIDDKQYEDAATCLLPFIDNLPASYDGLLTRVWSHIDHHIIEARLNDFLPLLERFIKVNGLKDSEHTIALLVEKLFINNDLQAVDDLLTPIRKLASHSLSLNKVSNMVKLSDNLDRMMELGDYFAEFKQYDQALECFFWEMELQPQDPDPVWRIMKMYQQKGVSDEAKAYQQLYTQLKAN
ncbi:tetratricopeptide repeat protein [Virgibacillus sp. DJP39]|uniref:tetratricopeptide repeat protein n=1 Tax=Virgibacillus sp. DJP39 TaxID=3409790 RepID=UPI003BB6ECF8